MAYVIEWVNACQVTEVTVGTVDDLADGFVLAAVLHHFVPDRFPAPSHATDATARLQDLCTELDMHLSGKLSTLIQADADGAAAGNQAELLRCILEATLLAAVQGPMNHDAISAIQCGLVEAKQHAIMGLLQNLMAIQGTAPAAAQGNHLVVPSNRNQRQSRRSISPRRASLAFMGGAKGRDLGGDGATPRDSCAFTSNEFELLKGELEDYLLQIEKETANIDDAERDEQKIYESLMDIRQKAYTEEEHALDHGARLAMCKKQKGDDCRKQNKEMEALERELHQINEYHYNLPEVEQELEEKAKFESDEFNSLSLRTQGLELELEQAMQADLHDADYLKDEIGSLEMEIEELNVHVQNVSQEEKQERQDAANLLQELCTVEDNTKTNDAEKRNIERRAEKEHESEQDTLGLMRFRESELQQIEDGMEKNAADTLQGIEMELTGRSSGKTGDGEKTPTSQREILRVYKDLMGARKGQNRLEALRREIVARAERLDSALLKSEAKVGDINQIHEARLEAEQRVHSLDCLEMEQSVETLRQTQRDDLDELARIKPILSDEESAVMALRIQLANEAAKAEKVMATQNEKVTEVRQARKVKEEAEEKAAQSEKEAIIRKREEAEAEAKARGIDEEASKEKAAEEANKLALIELKDEMLLRERQLHLLKTQCSHRKEAVRKEARLMLAVYHEITCRYHQLSSSFGVLSENLERRGL